MAPADCGVTLIKLSHCFPRIPECLTASTTNELRFGVTFVRCYCTCFQPRRGARGADLNDHDARQANDYHAAGTALRSRNGAER